MGIGVLFELFLSFEVVFFTVHFGPCDLCFPGLFGVDFIEFFLLFFYLESEGVASVCALILRPGVHLLMDVHVDVGPDSVHHGRLGAVCCHEYRCVVSLREQVLSLVPVCSV
jgi:hypothetical protein